MELLEMQSLPAPATGSELMTAEKICREQGYGLGIRFAERHVPEALRYSIETLRANQALSAGDEAGWLARMNGFLAHHGAAPVRLRKGKTLLDRFSTDALPRVNGEPLVSVIMPAWNAEDTIAAAAASILCQTWGNLGLLIVDDASEDGTWAEMQRIAASDSRVKILRNKINVGPYVSKNLAMTKAKGDWITGHDADDWAHPQRLEHHLNAVLAEDGPPSASVAWMLRLLPDGMIDEFTRLSYFSDDGVSRHAPISCLIETRFLRTHLGGWDCVRFGADSELMGRITTAIGDEFRSLPVISMLCISREGSLTNHPTLGVNRETGPSQVRRDYATAWRKWHQGLDGRLRMAFPPPLHKERPFQTPSEVVVPAHQVWRNYASVTDLDDSVQEDVTAICCSKRPGFLKHIARQLCEQSYRKLHVIYVAHGPGHDPDQINDAFGELANFKLLSLPDPEATLGEALNLALDHCKTDLVAKIDDDDFYGPDYIRSSAAALKFCGNVTVGVVGRARAYCYVEERDLLALRFKPTKSNNLTHRAFGSTIFWSRSKLGDLRFQDLPRAVDTAFYNDANELGVSVYSCDPYDHVAVRYARPGLHTWSIDADEFLRPATPLADGLRLDIAYSTQFDATRVQFPTREDKTEVTRQSTVKVDERIS